MPTTWRRSHRHVRRRGFDPGRLRAVCDDARSPTTGASADAAAAAAACGVLRGLFPNRAPQYEPACASYINALPDNGAKTKGLAVGNEVALGTLAFRANDGRSTVVTYTPGSDPGDFRGTNPALPFGPFIRPLALESVSQFRAEGPPDLTSYDYLLNFNEVKSLGSAASVTRTAAQTDLARFHTEPPPRFWTRNMRRFATDGRSVLEHARLMAMLWIAQADATNACFDSKYHFDFWRPQSSIPLAGTDGNPATVEDAGWAPVVPTPNHPEYPAAHACNAAAVATILERYFGSQQGRLHDRQRGNGPDDPVLPLSQDRRLRGRRQERPRLRRHALPQFRQRRRDARDARRQLHRAQLLQAQANGRCGHLAN